MGRDRPIRMGNGARRFRNGSGCQTLRLGRKISVMTSSDTANFG